MRIVKLIFLQNCHKSFFMTAFLPISFAYVSRVHTLIQPPLNVSQCVMQAIKCSSVYAANERLANRAAVFIAGVSIKRGPLYTLRITLTPEDMKIYQICSLLDCVFPPDM